MYISQVRLRNVRGFHGTRSAELTLRRPDGTHAGWTVIAGRNGSGKTSLLRGIALAVSGPAVTRNLVSDFDNWISNGRDVATSDVQLTWDRTIEKFTTGRPPKGPFWSGLEWRAPTEDLFTARRAPQPALLNHHIVTTQKNYPTRGPWQDNPTGWFCAAYGPFRRLAGGAGAGQNLTLSRGPAARLATLFHEDASLAVSVQWLIEQHLRSLEGKPGAAALKDIALAVLGDDLLPDSYRIDGVDSDGLWITDEHANHYPLREMSDGYRTVAALVVDLLKQINEAYGGLSADRDDQAVVINPGVVIIDEVDAHLHVSWQKRIGQWLKHHFPNIQFIVTTHSPYICQAADPSGLIRLPGPDEDVPPRVVEESLYHRIVYGSGDDAVLSDMFGLETPYSERAEALREELVSAELAVLSGTASTDTEDRYRHLRRTLTSSPTARVDEIESRLRSAGDRHR